MELMRLSNNIQFYKHKIALCQASNARIFYEKLLAKEAKRFQDLQLEYQRLDLRYQEVTPQRMEQEVMPNNETNHDLGQDTNQNLYQDIDQDAGWDEDQDNMELDSEILDQQEQDDMETEGQNLQNQVETQPEDIEQPNQEESESDSEEPEQPNQEEPAIDSEEPEQPNQEEPESDSQESEQPNQEGTEAVPDAQRVFTIEELSKYNGSGGQPAYVSVNGIVYDVSMEKRWGGGTHFSMIAGKNLTMNFNACHGGNIQVLKNLPQVGILKQ
jgi:predicted heme/steroid binding protein